MKALPTVSLTLCPSLCRTWLQTPWSPKRCSVGLKWMNYRVFLDHALGAVSRHERLYFILPRGGTREQCLCSSYDLIPPVIRDTLTSKKPNWTLLKCAGCQFTAIAGVLRCEWALIPPALWKTDQKKITIKGQILK